MKSIKIRIEDNELLVIHQIESQEKIFKFNPDQTVNLDELVKYISNFDANIVLNPPDTGRLLETGDIDEKVVKLSEYIYKIMYAFNDSYEEVYNTDVVDVDNS